MDCEIVYADILFLQKYLSDRIVFQDIYILEIYQQENDAKYLCWPILTTLIRFAFNYPIVLNKEIK